MRTGIPATQIDRACRPLQPFRRTRTCGLTCCITCRKQWQLVCGALSSQDAVAISDVTEISPQYKGILLDQFGVLHNGKHAYPYALRAVKKLAADGRKIVVLSNSSRRSSNTIPRLEKMGFERDWFSGAVTSGELTFRFLRDRPDGWWQGLGRKCLHLSWGARGAVSLDGLDLQTVLEPEEADFVVAHGTEVLGRGDGEKPVPAGLDEIEALLKRAAAKGLPLVVANPDVVTVSGDSLVPMPGTFARWFKEMGGEVRLMGKPDPIIYEAAMEVMGLAANEVLAVGDSLEHDISGATAAGIDSLFVAGGIHAEELGVSSAHLVVDKDRLTALSHEHKAYPDIVIPFLK